MFRLSHGLFALSLLFHGSFGGADELSRRVTLRYEQVLCCTTYWTTTTGHIDVFYFNPALPLGSAVSLQHGFERSDLGRSSLVVSDDWQEMALIRMNQWEEYGWQIRVSKEVYRRASSSRLTGFDFVFVIRLPDGQVLYDKGDPSPLGFMRSSLPVDPHQCVRSGENPESFKPCDLEVRAVVRGD